MTLPTSATRPVLALRIGITGARSLDAAHLPRLSAQLRTVLQGAQQQMHRLATQDRTAAAYHLTQGGMPQPVLRFLSPLARGADRLAAQTALALGYTLHVPMPFPQAVYETDFDTPEDLAEFHTLLPRTGDDWLALDGDHGPETNRAYEAVGRYVVRHSDILIAIWDGGPGAGRGGTADIVRYAALTGVPVCWLHATQDRAPAWIADIQDLRDPLPGPPPAEASLHAYLQTLIPPPAPSHRQRHGIIGRLARFCQGRHVAPEAEYFAEHPRKLGWPWRAYAELQLLAEQSRHMAAELERAQHRVERLDPQRPLVSQDIGAEAALVATLMLQDLDGFPCVFGICRVTHRANAHVVRDAQGSVPSARSWLTEAPLRMLMNNLDPDVAERPDAVTDQTAAHDPVNGYGDGQQLPLRL